MGLYWIAPNVFLNLDSRNIWYIYESGKIPADVVDILPKVEQKISAKLYFDISEKLQKYLLSERSMLKTFIELSYEAWKRSEQVNQGKKRLRFKVSETIKVLRLPMKMLIQFIIGYIRQVIMHINGTSFIRVALWQLVGEKLVI